jgi:hypothetical protein
MATAVKFRTKAQYVPVPVITWPTDGLDIAGSELSVVWRQQASSGFQVEFSTKPNFPPRSTTKVRIDEPTQFSCKVDDLAVGTWYIRVLAAAEGGYTEPSKVVTVKMGVPGGVSSVDDVPVTTTPTKIVENGHLYILRNGKRYNVLGNIDK